MGVLGVKSHEHNEVRAARFRYASHLTGRLNSPRNAQPPIRTGSV